jgi:hypothetical protein
VLNRVWFRYIILFAFTVAGFSLAPQPAPWLGAAMWAMAGAAAWRLTDDRESVVRTSLMFISAYAGAMIAYKLLFAVVNLDALVQELGVSVGARDAVASSWARNTALTVFGSSFLIPVYYGVWWFQAMFWRQPSRFFRIGATSEEQQALIKRGGQR